MNKKLPYGQSNYKNLVYNNFIYIEKLENFHSSYITFLRPRRFGKSLFTSVLANYYDIKEKDNFQKLFGDTYIGKNPTEERNSYYILKLNFTGLNTDSKETLEESFTRTIKDSFDKFIEAYKLEVTYLQEGFAASIFEDFLTRVSFKIKEPIYVIIDEYNHFANELLSFQTELFSNIVSKTGFVRKFYEVLKKGTESIVKRIFMTGVSPITLDSLTSGFNISMDMTRHEDFNEMMGFTREEVIGLIKCTVKKPLSDTDLKELLETLQKNYNGYLFSEECKTRLFNSDMILYYMQSYMDSRKGPKSLIDKNIASDYGKLGRMFDLKDIALLKQVNMEPTYFAIFELKYITKAEYERIGEKIVEEKKKEAIEQLEKYKGSEELMSLPNLKKWALIFVNDICMVNIEIQ